MSLATYKRIQLVLILGLIGLGFLSWWWGQALLIFFGLLLVMMLLSLLRLRVKGVLVDERQAQISEKSARVSFLILFPILLLTSVALVMGGGQSDFFYVRALGIVIAYVTLLAGVIYLLAYWYFDRESGGG